VRDANYTTVLFDLDHTLMDSDASDALASEALAFERTMRLLGVDEPRLHMPHYDRINKALWQAVERQEIAGYFDAIVISGEVGSSKPHAAIFDIAFRQLGMRRRRRP
jgi:FMN phosphatase YigB (HAD superfamily)